MELNLKETKVPIISLEKGTLFRLKSDGIIYVMDYCMIMNCGKYLCRFHSDFNVQKKYLPSKMVLLGV